MRRYQQTLMVLITFLVIISFAWFYNNTRFDDRMGADRVGNLYGKSISQAEYLSAARKFEVCRMLQMFEYLGGLASVGGQRGRNDFEENFVWNSFVLRHEANALGIQPTESEIIGAVQKLPAFQTNGVYDSSRYNAFVQGVLQPRGFTTDQFEEIIADSLRFEKIKDLLASTDAAVPAEIRAAYEKRNRKTEASVIRLKLEDFKKEVKVTDEDLQKRFEERKANLVHPEKRKAKYVVFGLEKSDKPLVGKERNVALQKLADQANDVAVAVADKGAKLDEIAAKMNVPVKESPEFDLGAPPKELDESAAIAEAAFALSQDNPHSDAVKSEGDSYYVLELAGITPATPMTFDDAKKQLTDEIIQERATEAMQLRAADFRTKITEAVKGGKPFADAAKEAGATVEPFPPFSPAEPKFDQPDAREVMIRAGEMTEGELSEFTPTATGGLLIRVDKIQPADNAGFEKVKPMLTSELERNKREGAFQQWLKERRGAAGLTEAKG